MLTTTDMDFISKQVQLILNAIYLLNGTVLVYVVYKMIGHMYKWVVSLLVSNS